MRTIYFAFDAVAIPMGALIAFSHQFVDDFLEPPPEGWHSWDGQTETLQPVEGRYR